MDIQRVLSRNILYYLELNGKKQSDLAKDLNISKAMVSMWCSEVNFPRADKIMMLAKYFNINFIDLFTDKSKKNADLEEINAIASQLDEEYKKILISQANALLEMQKKK